MARLTLASPCSRPPCPCPTLSLPRPNSGSLTSPQPFCLSPLSHCPCSTHPTLVLPALAPSCLHSNISLPACLCPAAISSSRPLCHLLPSRCLAPFSPARLRPKFGSWVSYLGIPDVSYFIVLSVLSPHLVEAALQPCFTCRGRQVHCKLTIRSLSPRRGVSPPHHPFSNCFCQCSPFSSCPPRICFFFNFAPFK